tara:strand:- start:4516 stop:5754 length:1239 start_codon:yes stop_codon:yes gene_type:complete
MQLLVRPDPFPDESLESYLLRLAEANFIESYGLLSGAVRDWLWQHNHDAAGAFPLELSRVNIYHANQSSGLRVRALKLVETLTDIDRLPLLKLALLHSASRFCNGHNAVFRNGVDIPRCFIRREGVPVCPSCLEESPYIRQHWHWSAYQACTAHGCELLHRCPACDKSLDYLRHELLSKCSCGLDLAEASVSPASEDKLQLSRLVTGDVFDSRNPLLQTQSLSVRNGVLLWHFLHTGSAKAGDIELDSSGLASAIGYFEDWPASLMQELEAAASNADQKLLKDFNKTAFQHIFGDILLASRWLPVSDLSKNFVMATVMEFLSSLVDSHPKSKRANVADLLLTVPEAAAVLSTTHEQVYRLYQEGYLELAFKPQLHQKLAAYKPAFYLRQVVELLQTRMQSDAGMANVYLPVR